MNYQAVARNSAGAPLLNSSVAVRISIRDSIASGTVLYSERDTATTNAFGLFTCKVGMGNIISGTFSTIDWSTNNKFLQVDLDPTGGSSYTNMGTTQLLSVPYALYAKSRVTVPDRLVLRVLQGLLVIPDPPVQQELRVLRVLWVRDSLQPLNREVPPLFQTFSKIIQEARLLLLPLLRAA